MAAGFSTVAAADPRWDVPAAAQEGFLPKLGAVKLDGDLAEWNAAAAVPLRFVSYIAQVKPSHTWNGPSDCGMEALCGWNEEGLCLAGFVADDDILNDTPPERSYEKDCLELYIDGRVGEAFMKPPYTKGAYHVFVRPPVGGKAVELAFNTMYASTEGARVAGKQVPGGWTFELVIPWNNFPGYAPRAGSALGLQFGLNDYDARDADTIQPLTMSWQAATSLFMSPQKMVKWTLVDAFPRGAGTALSAVAALDMPSACDAGTSIKAVLELGRTTAALAASGAYEIKNWTGAAVAKGPVVLAKAAPPWQDSAAGGFEWALGDARDGVYTVEVTFADSSGAPLGGLRRSITLSRFTIQEGHAAVTDAVTRIEQADIARLSQSEPLRAAAWMGAAACVEKLKWAVDGRNRLVIQAIRSELLARLAVLEPGGLPAECARPYSLLALTAQPEAQVVVEFGAPRDFWGTIQGDVKACNATFLWANVPMAVVSIREYPDADAARKTFDQMNPFEPWQRPRKEGLQLAGLPARSVQWPFAIVTSDLARFDPTRQVLVCAFSRSRLVVVDAAAIDWIEADAVTVSDSAPRPVRNAVRSWAKKAGKPLVDFRRAATNAWCLVAGFPADEKDLQNVRQIKRVLKAVPQYDLAAAAAPEFQSPFLDGAVPQQDPGLIAVLDNNRIIIPHSASRETAEIAVRLVKAGRPVTVADTDALRLAVLRAIPNPPGMPAAGTNMNLYAGDTHMHSRYSDGISTPVGMALQAMYCGMDFVALTDHNTMDGSLVAGKLFRACGVGFPVLPAMEVTTGWGHFNAYPLREPISPTLSPYEIVKAAHAQGAVIQWNHPGRGDKIWAEWYPSDGQRALRGTGVDAWEHPVPEYNQWKAAGRLPVMVGSTDTHGGMFGHTERTLILAPSPAPDDVAEAIRREATLLISSGDPRLFLGADDMIARAVAALAAGPATREQWAARIKASLAKADIPALLRKSPATIVKPADLTP
jgi:hypothetical protein